MNDLRLLMIRFLQVFATIQNCSNGLKVNFCTAVASMAIRNVDFEVFGRVQGVFFRKYTKEQANKLDLKGWCRNTSRGTVEGQMQGPSEKIDAMKHWLKTTGSPSSKIDKADFKNDKDISEYSFSNFDIRRDD